MIIISNYDYNNMFINISLSHDWFHSTLQGIKVGKSVE